MRKAILFIAMSLDGYIADENGAVDWLGGENPEAEALDSYAAFIKNIDTVIMGWTTYQQITTKLSPNEWPYPDLTSYVITHRPLPAKDTILFTEHSPAHLLKELKRKKGKDIWICGGASIAQQLISQDFIDEYYLSIIPTILGKGLRLFDGTTKKMDLKLLHTQSYNGITDLIYARKGKNSL